MTCESEYVHMMLQCAFCDLQRANPGRAILQFGRVGARVRPRNFSSNCWLFARARWPSLIGMNVGSTRVLAEHPFINRKASSDWALRLLRGTGISPARHWRATFYAIARLCPTQNVGGAAAEAIRNAHARSLAPIRRNISNKLVAFQIGNGSVVPALSGANGDYRPPVRTRHG